MNRQTLFTPLLIGILAITLTVAIIIGWNMMFTSYYTLATETRFMTDLGAGYWLLLSIGDVFLALIVTALVLFLVSSVRQVLYMQRQKTFIDSVTHELKSPLASLRLCLDTMEVRELTPEMRGKFVRMMKDDVNRLQAFIEHILEAGRLEHNERELEYESTRIPDMIGKCVRQIVQRHHIQADMIRVDMHLARPENPIVTDPIALETIILNLLDNAVKYSGRNPKPVAVTVRDDGNRLRIEVKDAGIGIPPTKLKKIFRRFYRVNRKGKDISGVRGTGLGLYVVRSLVKRLNGRITATSEGENRGATFRVELPMTPLDSAAIEKS